MKKEYPVVCKFARIDVKGAGKRNILEAIKNGRRVVAKVEIVLNDEYSEDAVSIEFSGEVTSCVITEE